MSARKTVLLVSIAVLAAVCVLQTVLDRRDSVHVLSLSAKDAPDAITVAGPGGSNLVFEKSGSGWVIGDKKYPADASRVQAMIDALTTVKTLGTVSLSNDYERYGLSAAERLTVSATKGGKTVRALAVGKNSSASGQSYALVDGKSSVSLVSGNLKDVFSGDILAFREKALWSVPADAITRVEVSSSAKDTAFAAAKAGNPVAWQIVSPAPAKAFAADLAKISAWAMSFASVRADSFADEGTAAAAKPSAVITVTAGGKAITLTVGEKSASGNASRYLCSTSESPYSFWLSSRTAESLLVPFTSFAK